MGHIFISYSHKDSWYVHQLAEALEQEGFGVWIDDRIHFGSEWPKVVTRNLDASDGVIVVLSSNSYESDMVQNEVARAREKKKPIFPLLLDGENWLIVQARQFVDVRDGSLPTEKFYKRLEAITPRKNVRAEREAAEKAAREKAKREAAEKAEREKAEKITREKLERETAAKAMQERAKREAAEKAKRERSERLAVEIAALKETFSKSFHKLRSTLITAMPFLRIVGILGIIFVLCWAGSSTLSNFPLVVPTATASATSHPSATATFTHSPLPPPATLKPTVTKTRTPTSPLELEVEVKRFAWVRYGPGTMFRAMISVTQGDHLKAIGQSLDQNWLVVELDNGEIGWINKDSLTSQEAEYEFLPVFENPPTPTPAPTFPPTKVKRKSYPPGDFNRDCVVNDADYALFQSAFGTNSPTYDLNGDGTVDISDYQIFSNHYGDTC